MPLPTAVGTADNLESEIAASSLTSETEFEQEREEFARGIARYQREWEHVKLQGRKGRDSGTPAQAGASPSPALSAAPTMLAECNDEAYVQPPHKIARRVALDVGVPRRDAHDDAFEDMDVDADMQIEENNFSQKNGKTVTTLSSWSEPELRQSTFSGTGSGISLFSNGKSYGYSHSQQGANANANPLLKEFVGVQSPEEEEKQLAVLKHAMGHRHS